jgi:hypothetical protein
MKWTGAFSAPRLDLNVYREILHRHMSEVIAQAVLTWLSAVVDQIPVWSGASRATFIPLAAKIEYAIPISPVVGSRVALGMGSSQGDVVMDQGRGLYTFEYGTTLPWLIWNEYHNANENPDATKWPPPAKLQRPGPYQFQRLGQDAFRKFAEQVALPLGVSKCVKPVKIKIG